MGVKKYKLYAGIVREKIPKGAKYSFIPSSLKYLLVYMDETPTGRFNEISEEQIPKGESGDEIRRWLRNCKAEVNAKTIKEYAQAINEQADEFLKLFESELKKKQEKQASGEHEESGNN